VLGFSLVCCNFGYLKKKAMVPGLTMLGGRIHPVQDGSYPVYSLSALFYYLIYIHIACILTEIARGDCIGLSYDL